MYNIYHNYHTYIYIYACIHMQYIAVLHTHMWSFVWCCVCVCVCAASPRICAYLRTYRHEVHLFAAGCWWLDVWHVQHINTEPLLDYKWWKWWVKRWHDLWAHAMDRQRRAEKETQMANGYCRHHSKLETYQRTRRHDDTTFMTSCISLHHSHFI